MRVEKQIKAIVILVTLSLFSCNQGIQQANKQETAFDRVVSTNVIRAGYVVYPPGSIKDPNTGELSGVFVEIMEAAAKSLSLRVEWVEEVGWGSMIEGLKASRYDIIGTPVWANSSRARQVDFGTPIYFSGIGAFVRYDESRFNQLRDLDSPSVRIATIDGEMSSILAQSDFPQAQAVSLPQLSDNSQMLLNVVENRADVTFVEPYIANLFLKQNPGTLKNLAPDEPLRFFSTTIMINQGEDQLRRMLNVAIQEQLNSGALDRLFIKYSVPSGSFYPPALPYRVD